MVDDAFGNGRSKAIGGMAGKDRAGGEGFQDGFHLIVEDGVAMDLMFAGAAGCLGQPLLNLLAAVAGVEFGGATQNAAERQVVLTPEPAEGEEGKAVSPRGGEDDMSLRAGRENALQLLHACWREDMRVIRCKGVQDPVDIKEDDVKEHRRDVTPGVKNRARTQAGESVSRCGARAWNAWLREASGPEAARTGGTPVAPRRNSLAVSVRR